MIEPGLDPCGFKWLAPYMQPPNETNNWTPYEGRKEQVCVLPKGHEGEHRSLSNVTSELR